MTPAPLQAPDRSAEAGRRGHALLVTMYNAGARVQKILDLRPCARELTQRDPADAIGVPYRRVNEIVRRRRGVAPSTALRLARLLDTSPGFWMNLQLTWDLFHAHQVEGQDLKRISPLLKSSGVVVR